MSKAKLGWAVGCRVVLYGLALLAVLGLLTCIGVTYVLTPSDAQVPGGAPPRASAR